MIFTPSVNGISHNVTEYTAPDDLEAGANVLLDVLLHLTEADWSHDGRLRMTVDVA